MKLLEVLLRRLGVELPEQRKEDEAKKQEVTDRQRELADRIQVLKIKVAIQTRDYRDEP